MEEKGTNNKERVVFYSKHDMSLGFQLPRLKEVMDDYAHWHEYIDINDIIELYCIKQILDIDFETCLWDKETKELFATKRNEIVPIVGSFFSRINDNTFPYILNSIYIRYQRTFWELFEKFKIYENISESLFSRLLQKSIIPISEILHHEKTVNYYNKTIKNYIFGHVSTAEMIITEFLEKHDDDYKQYHFPKDLTLEDKVNLVNQYIESQEANLNFLELISKSKTTDGLKINSKTRLKAKKNFQERVDLLLQTGSTYKYSTIVEFLPLGGDVVKYEVNGTDHHFKYATNWIYENLDYPTILNNFFYVFGFTDLHFRWSHVNKRSMFGPLDIMIGKHGNREYVFGSQFNSLQILSLEQIQGYYHVLADKGIYLENVIKWFFEEYIPEQFQISGFSFNLSSSGTSYLEKCRNLLIEIDSVLKQFKLFCRERKIDRDLFEIDTEHLIIKDVPSCINDKYLYPNGKVIEKILYLLFSNQSLLFYRKNNGEHYHNPYQALRSEKINFDDISPYHIGQINMLLNYKILFLDSDNNIAYDPKLLYLLHDLFENEVCCNHHMKTYSDQVQFLKDSDMVYFDSTLLSKPEQEYFNFIFNNSQFDNSLDLRNKYLHGNQSLNDEVIKNDYFIILKMLVLIVIKINDEFCTVSDNNLLK